MENTLIKSVMAGIAIALGCCMYLLAPNPIVGALLFSCGLLCVRIYQLNLFTGKIQYMITSKYPWRYYGLVFFGNMLGAALMGGITFILATDAATSVAAAKASQPILIALIKGIGCGMLMSLATYKDSPLWMCLLCVPGFILAGFNHCVADIYYAVAGWNIGLPFIATVLGNIIGGALLLNNYWNVAK